MNYSGGLNEAFMPFIYEYFVHWQCVSQTRAVVPHGQTQYLRNSDMGAAKQHVNIMLCTFSTQQRSRLEISW